MLFRSKVRLMFVVPSVSICTRAYGASIVSRDSSSAVGVASTLSTPRRFQENSGSFRMRSFRASASIWKLPRYENAGSPPAVTCPDRETLPELMPMLAMGFR